MPLVPKTRLLTIGNDFQVVIVPAKPVAKPAEAVWRSWRTWPAEEICAQLRAFRGIVATAAFGGLATRPFQGFTTIPNRLLAVVVTPAQLI
jgi:hypothetical protein